jgi:hypothetical protein
VPVQKFADPNEARRALWVPSGASDLAARIRALWAFSRRLAPSTCPCGLKKFESIDEANADREARILRRTQDLRRRRGG